MKELVIPFINRARKYGYIIWRKKSDEEIRNLLKGKSKIEVVVNDEAIGFKNVDWVYRRIPITYTRTRSLPKKFTKIGMTIDTRDRLIVRFF